MAGFSCSAPIETIALKCDGRVGRPGELVGDAPVELEPAGTTHLGDFTVRNPVCRTRRG